MTLFYLSIFGGCLVVALVLPWFYRMVCRAITALRSSIRPDKEKGPTSHLQACSRFADKKDSLESESRIFAVRSQTNSQKSEDGSYFGPMKEYTAPLQAKVELKSAGWIRREDKHTVSGRTYKVNRRLKVREVNPHYMSKPESWS